MGKIVYLEKDNSESKSFGLEYQTSCFCNFMFMALLQLY